MKKRKSDRPRAGGNGKRPRPSIPPPAVVDGLDLPLLEPELYINRELSWLAFNERVLEEASKSRHPLLERIKFAAIVAANLDEFFMIRVAGVKRKLSLGVSEPGPDGRTPVRQIAAIREKTQQQLDAHSSLVRQQLLPELAAAGIRIVPYNSLTDDERAALSNIFERDIFPVLTPQAIDRGRPFPHVSNRSLNLISVLRLPTGERFARTKVPATLPRLIRLPSGSPESSGGAADRTLASPARFTWLEQVVAAHLPRLFPGAEVLASYPFHVTRDSDIDVDEDDEDDDTDLMMTMRESISQRAFGPVVRLMIDRQMPDHVRDWLVEHLNASERDLYLVDGPLALEDLFEVAALDRSRRGRDQADVVPDRQGLTADPGADRRPRRRHPGGGAGRTEGAVR